MPRFFSIFFVLIFLGPGCSTADAFQEGTPQNLPLEALQVETDEGVLDFEVQIAATAEQKRIGLMFRTNMPDGEGMLFTYRRPEPVGFWMRNTYISLDLIFIREDGTIANIAAHAVPFSLESIYSEGAVTGVLEINGGLAKKLGIEPGDKVLHPHFQGGE